MRPLTIDDVLPVERFVAERDRHLARVTAAKAARRLALGTNLTLLFENRTTVLWQIHEMCRVEGIRSPEGVAHELDSYNPLVPGSSELSTTLLVEYDDAAERAEMLRRLVGLKDHLRLEIEGEAAVPGRFEEGREDLERQRISAVHFVRFALDASQGRAFLDLGRPATFVVDHPAYTARASIPPAVRGALAEDLLAD